MFFAGGLSGWKNCGSCCSGSGLHEGLNFGAHSLLELIRDSADKFSACKTAAQPHYECSLRIHPGEISSHRINLSFDGVARYSPFGPALRNHRTDPHVLLTKQFDWFSRFTSWRIHAASIKPVPMQGEVLCFCNGGSGQNGLKLRPGFKPLHWRPASVKARKTGLNAKSSLDSQAFTALGAAGSNHCAATTGFHACQKAVGAGALDFGRLVGAFHGKSWWPCGLVTGLVSCKASFGDSNDFGQLQETTANLASLNNRQHICFALTGDFWTKSHAKLRRQPQAATNRENP